MKRQNDRSLFQTEDFSNIRRIGKIDCVRGLHPDAPINRDFGGYVECSVSHGVEDGHDTTDCVVSRRDLHLLIIRVCDYISRIRVYKHDLFGSKQDSDESDGWVPILVRIDPFDRNVTK